MATYFPKAKGLSQKILDILHPKTTYILKYFENPINRMDSFFRDYVLKKY